MTGPASTCPTSFPTQEAPATPASLGARGSKLRVLHLFFPSSGTMLLLASVCDGAFQITGHDPLVGGEMNVVGHN